MKKKKKTILIILLSIVIVLAVGMIIGYQAVLKEHVEIMSLSLDAVDFSSLNDGVFVGEFEGGMYGWRKNKVQVTVLNNKVVEIKLLEPPLEAEGEDDELLKLYKRVIKNQSLDVDSISGATISSKGYLKAVENALIQANQ